MSYQSVANHLWAIIISISVSMLLGYYWLRYALDIGKRNKRMNVQVQLLKAIAEKLEISDTKIDEILTELPGGEKEALLADEAAYKK